jgi:hypothetical protein
MRGSLMNSSSRISLALMLLGLSVLMPAAVQAQGGGNTCVFVFGTINGQTVTTPSVMVVVPPTSVILGPTRVHVDPDNFTILGFTLTTPGADQTVNGTSLFVPGVDRTVPSYSATLDGLNVSNKTCLNFGVTTPAVEIDVPTSVLTVPGALVDTPEITINALGINKTVAGQTLTIDSQTIVIPGDTETVPSQTVGTPACTLAVGLNGTVLTAPVLAFDTGLGQVVPPPQSSPRPPGCQAQ